MTRTAILLINLGTVCSPTLGAVFRYLNEFLTDPLVIDLPWWKRQLLVRGCIIPQRLSQVTHSYQKIWMADGSPLLVYGQRIKALLQKSLAHQGEFLVELAMRYQEPSIQKGLKQIVQWHPDRLVVLPLFPHFATATSGSVHQKFYQEWKRYGTSCKIEFISHFGAHPAFIEAFQAVSSTFDLKEYDHILFSYHGLPLRKNVQLDLSGRNLPYTLQCQRTTEALANKLSLAPERYTLCFQSRLGKEEWLQPYASEIIQKLAKEGKRRLLVFCPSFVCDCLETLFEIGEEYQTLFKTYGGEKLELVPGLNDHPAWIFALQKICLNDRIGDSLAH